MEILHAKYPFHDTARALQICTVAALIFSSSYTNVRIAHDGGAEAPRINKTLRAASIRSGEWSNTTQH